MKKKRDSGEEKKERAVTPFLNRLHRKKLLRGLRGRKGGSFKRERLDHLSSCSCSAAGTGGEGREDRDREKKIKRKIFIKTTKWPSRTVPYKGSSYHARKGGRGLTRSIDYIQKGGVDGKKKRYNRGFFYCPWQEGWRTETRWGGESKQSCTDQGSYKEKASGRDQGPRVGMPP